MCHVSPVTRAGIAAAAARGRIAAEHAAHTLRAGRGGAARSTDGKGEMAIDDSILTLLQNDGRASYSDIAATTGVPRGTVTNRIRALTEEGILRFTATVHPQLIGRNTMAHVSLQTSGHPERVLRALTALPGAIFVSSIGGEYAIIVELRLRDQHELYATLAQIRQMPYVIRVDTLLYVEALLGHFLPGTPLPPGTLIDATDRRLLALLREDPRATYAAVAEKLQITPVTARNRIQSLEERQMIRFGILVNRARHRAAVVAGVGINVTNDGAAAVAALRDLGGVEFLARTIGRYDVLATITAPSSPELGHILQLLGRVPGVSRVQSWSHLDVVKERHDWGAPLA